MGVTSLWEIVGPSARPVRLEALSKKKLAVDASIWIYQFMKAVRDREGNSLPLSHIVGFFKRICKLLYFGILPVFVFDGGAPELKRKTINKRRERREGQRETREQTARKLLAIQVQRQVQEGTLPSKRRKVVANPTEGDNKEEIAYLEDVENVGSGNDLVPIETDQLFVKKDEYHLPYVGEIKSHKDDQRVVSNEEYREYADIGGDFLEGIDIDKAHPGTEEFENLPLESQYMVLWHLRMRSRLRMGYTKEQLQAQFPKGIEFSKFQVKQVQKRNFYTQKLLDVAGYNDKNETTQRIAGAKDREYTLMRSDNGWTLALNDGEDAGTSDTPITFDEFGNVVREPTKNNETHRKEVNDNYHQPPKKGSLNIDDDEDEWEDVDVESKTGNADAGEKAFIESIYENYTGNPGKVEFDETEMKIAIQESKNDYLALQEKESSGVRRAIEKSKKDDRSSKKKSDFDNDPNSKSLFLFDYPKETLHGADKENKQIQKSSENITSFLFDDHEITPNLKNKPNRRKEYQSTSKEDFNQFNQTDQNGLQNTLSKPIYVNQDIIIEDDSDVIEEEKPQEVEKEANVTVTSKPVPEWFNLDVSVTDTLYKGLTRHNQPQEFNDAKLMTTDSPIRKARKQYEDDEQAGLISWNEARDYIRSDESSDESDLEEVQITEPQEIVAETQVDGLQDVVVTEDADTQLTSKSDEDIEVILDTNIKDARPIEVLDYDFEEEEEEKLVQQIKEEDEQYEYFKTKVVEPKTPLESPMQSSITQEQLLQEQLQKAKRDADEVTATMINDVQELLRRFGVPFMTAPMEAEAQCAKLMKLGLVDGIITDDSDCFLFGGDKIYKNMFNQKTYVECYFKDRINEELGLNQKKLIELALLLGSDYTEGIKGIGPVMAMEILAEFGDLKKFKRWFDENTQKVNKTDADSKLKKSLLQRVKNGKLFLPSLFPDPIVTQAYIDPEVDDDETEFKWGVPNLDQIRSFLMYNVKWTQGRVDEVLVPLIKDINRKKAEGVQSTLGEFFPQEYIKSKKELNLGKRIKDAASRLKEA